MDEKEIIDRLQDRVHFLESALEKKTDEYSKLYDENYTNRVRIKTELEPRIKREENAYDHWVTSPERTGECVCDCPYLDDYIYKEDIDKLIAIAKLEAQCKVLDNVLTEDAGECQYNVELTLREYKRDLEKLRKEQG